MNDATTPASTPGSPTPGRVTTAVEGAAGLPTSDQRQRFHALMRKRVH